MKPLTKKSLGIAIFFIFTVFHPPASHSGEVYRWEDEDGTVQMTDNPQNIPENIRKRVKEITLPQEKKGPPPSLQRPEALKTFPTSERVDKNGHDREWWQTQVKGWSQKKAKAEGQLAEADSELGRLRMTNPSVAVIQQEAAVRKEIDRLREEIRDEERMLKEQLPEEARKSQAPPGWLRE